MESVDFSLRISEKSLKLVRLHSKPAKIEDYLNATEDEFKMAFTKTTHIVMDFDCLFDIDVAIGSYLALAVSNDKTHWAWQLTHVDAPNTEMFRALLGDRQNRNPIRNYDISTDPEELDELYYDITNNVKVMRDVLISASFFKTSIFAFFEKLVSETSTTIDILCRSENNDIASIKADVFNRVLAELKKTYPDSNTQITTMMSGKTTLIGDISGADEVYIENIDDLKDGLSLVADGEDINVLTNTSILVPNWSRNMMKENYVNIDQNLLFAMVTLNCQVGSYNAYAK